MRGSKTISQGLRFSDAGPWKFYKDALRGRDGRAVGPGATSTRARLPLALTRSIWSRRRSTRPRAEEAIVGHPCEGSLPCSGVLCDPNARRRRYSALGRGKMAMIPDASPVTDGTAGEESATPVSVPMEAKAPKLVPPREPLLPKRAIRSNAHYRARA